MRNLNNILRYQVLSGNCEMMAHLFGFSLKSSLFQEMLSGFKKYKFAINFL